MTRIVLKDTPVDQPLRQPGATDAIGPPLGIAFSSLVGNQISLGLFSTFHAGFSAEKRTFPAARAPVFIGQSPTCGMAIGMLKDPASGRIGHRRRML
jgi:hypothetical protein